MNEIEEDFHNFVESRGYLASVFHNSHSVSFIIEEHDPVEDARCVVARGEVKWDECSNWDLAREDEVMHHFCSAEDIKEFGEILVECHNFAMYLMEQPAGAPK